MSTEPLVPTPSATVPAREAAAAAAQRRLRVDPRYVPPFFITCILVVGHLSVGMLESPWHTGLAIVTAVVMELILGRLYFGKWPNLASAYITGISVGILVRSRFYWPFALCSAISIASKYVLRVKGRHIWNPSNFGIAMLLFLAQDTVASLSVQFGNSLGPLVVIWALGAVIIYRLKRFHICLTYVISFLFFAAVRSQITGDPLLAEIAPITGPMYQLFTFFMITDPRTTVRSKQGQMLVAFLVAAMEFILRLFHNQHAPYYALFFVGPVANLVEIWNDTRREKQAAG